MSKLSPETLASFGQLQDQIWKSVATALASATEPALEFSCEAPESVAPESLRTLAGETVLAIQFSFASASESNQLVLISAEDFGKLASFAKSEGVEPDESLIPEMREVLEGIVQGICLACGIAKNEPMVASGLSLRFAALSLPDNFGRNEDLVKVDVTFTAPNLSGSLTWYLDNHTVAYISGQETGAEASFLENPASVFDPDFGGSVGDPVEAGGLDLLLDIPLEISVELGRVKMLVKEVVELGTGSIVEIDKAAGEPVDVMVNGRLVARGEVVVIEDNFGVRITEILSAQERVTRLGEAA